MPTLLAADVLKRVALIGYEDGEIRVTRFSDELTAADADAFLEMFRRPVELSDTPGTVRDRDPQAAADAERSERFTEHPEIPELELWVDRASGLVVFCACDELTGTWYVHKF